MSLLPKAQKSLASALGDLVNTSHPNPFASFQSLAADIVHETLPWSVAEAAGVRITVRRDDLLHPLLSGNKAYKLVGHLREAALCGRRALISMGGAYSNHLYALAVAAKMLGWPCIGIVRGEKPTRKSPTLVDLESMGMRLRYVPRSEYRRLRENCAETLAKACPELDDYYWIPEGGGGRAGALGCQMLGALLSLGPEEYIAMACGTGTTLLGIARGITESSSVFVHKKCLLGISALQLGSSLLHARAGKSDFGTRLGFFFSNQFHCGGFAKSPEALQRFCLEFSEENSLALDRVYTAKLFWGLSKLIQSNTFPPGSAVLALHSGGMQGNRQ